jgi:hypothetical protein
LTGEIELRDQNGQLEYGQAIQRVLERGGIERVSMQMSLHTNAADGHTLVEELPNLGHVVLEVRLLTLPP